MGEGTAGSLLGEDGEAPDDIELLEVPEALGDADHRIVLEDIGDAAGLLRVLPTRRRVRAADSAFSAHCTVAIENDLVFCAERTLMQAVTLGALLWSLRTLQDMFAP